MFPKNIFSKSVLLNLTIMLIPASYIAGNLILNLNILILIFLVFLFFGLEVFSNKLTKIDLLIVMLFGYILINGIINNFFNFEFSSVPDENIILKKSFLYLRFLILYFVIKFLIVKELLNYKLLFLAFGACSLFVSFDILIQYFFGKDIFGFKGDGRRLSGPFGNEYIAGSFIQRFYIFLPFFLLLFVKIKKESLSNLLFLSILLVSILGALFSGNRVPLILFILSLVMIFFFQKSLRRNLLIIFIIFSSSYFYLIKNNESFSNHYNSFVMRSYQIADYFKSKATSSEIKVANIYIKELQSGIFTWEKNKLFGGGIKSFYWHCSTIDRDKMLLFVTKRGAVNCNSHPHNYYLQIAGELGIFGLFLFIFTFFYILISALRVISLKENIFLEKKMLIPFLILFFVEIFPIKTTGNFFTTTNSTYLFIILTFVVGLLEFKNNKKYYEGR